MTHESDTGDCPGTQERDLLQQVTELMNRVRDVDAKLDFLIREVRHWMVNHRHNNGTHFPY